MWYIRCKKSGNNTDGYILYIGAEGVNSFALHMVVKTLSNTMYICCYITCNFFLSLYICVSR